MKSAILILSLACALCTPAIRGSDFEFAIIGRDLIIGEAGETAQVHFDVRIKPLRTLEPGVSEWVVPIAVEGGRIESIRRGGALPACFCEQDCGGDPGSNRHGGLCAIHYYGEQEAVASVVLSLTEPEFLPAHGESRILTVTVEAEIPQLDTEVSLSVRPVETEFGLVEPQIGYLGTAVLPPSLSKTTTLSSTREMEFLRGDANNSGAVDISDGVWSLILLFVAAFPPPCQDAVDSNDDGRHDIVDPIYALNFLFLGGPAPPSPGVFRCGPDPTEDQLTCDWAICS